MCAPYQIVTQRINSTIAWAWWGEWKSAGHFCLIQDDFPEAIIMLYVYIKGEASWEQSNVEAQEMGNLCLGLGCQ